MKIQIIPDIHTKYIDAELLIEKENADQVVFLGDYFDAIGDTPVIAYQVAQWLKDSLSKPNRTHLIGNHDISYMTNGNQPCSGWDGAKQLFVNNVGVPWKSLQYYTWVGDWLCTHAGLSYEFYKAFATSGMNVNDLLETLSKDKDLRFRLSMCSRFRGGNDSYPGILWCDYDEFVDIPDTKQIFGHTHGELRQTENHICIDTWLKNYGLYDTHTDIMEIKT